MGMVPASHNKNPFESKALKYQSPAGILLHSRTVVEKKDYVSTGVLSFAEGDILEIELTEFAKFTLGEAVKLTIYSPGGIYTINSTVVAKAMGSIIVINPPNHQAKFAEKREHPRVMVNHSGVLHSIKLPGDSAPNDAKAGTGLSIKNISISGVGFSIPEDIGITKDTVVEIELELETRIRCVAEIIRFEPVRDGLFYGAQYVEISNSNSLRAFVLKKQVEGHFLLKKEEFEKRKFK